MRTAFILFSYFAKDAFGMKEKAALVFLTLIFLLALVAFGMYTFSQSSSLLLEAEQHWETYGSDGTCIPGTHNLFVADVDADDVKEIMTGGFMYNIINGSRATVEAPLKIWNWNGQNLTLEKSQKWSGSIGCVHASDVDGDGAAEIVTVECMGMGPLCDPDMRIWSIQNAAVSPPFLIFVITSIITATVLYATVFFVVKKRREPCGA